MNSPTNNRFPAPVPPYRLRLLMLGAFTVLAFIGLQIRLWWLQIDQKAYYEKKLPSTKKAKHRTPGPRGRILDRNGVELARNRTVFQLNLDLGEIISQWRKKNPKAKIPKFRPNIRGDEMIDPVPIVKEMVIDPMSELGIEARFTDESLRKHYVRFANQVPFEFKRDLPWELFAQIAENTHKLPGVLTSQRQLREYPHGALAGQLLGYVRLFDQTNTDPEFDSFKFYEGDDYGVQALEAHLDKVLRGKPGIREILVNEHGRLDRTVSSTEPGSGNDVHLTLDIRAQYIAHMAMQESLPRIGRGAAVVMDPNTGEILAMVTVPNYDPNNFIPSITEDAFQHYREDETRPLGNRAVQEFPPGSTFKLAVGMAGFLNPGGVSGYYSCDNYVTYGNRPFPCWTVQKQMGGHGGLDLTGGIKNSCNCYFYLYGNAAGIKNIQKMGGMLGMGKRTGVELPEDVAGLLPGPEWFRQERNLNWSDAQTANVSIGQGAVMCTPLQLCSMAATIANAKVAHVPSLVHHQYDPVTNTSTTFTPNVRTDLIAAGLKPAQIEKVRKGMWRVVNEQGGTGSRFRSELPEIKDNGGGAGKTGTAQNWRQNAKGSASIKDNLTWFVSFAPYDNPRLACCVMVQNGNSGGSCAAPVAKRIVERIMMAQAGSYQIDGRALGRVPEAKGNFNAVEAVSYADDNTSNLEPITDDDSGMAEEEPVIKPKAIPNNTVPLPSFTTEADTAAPKARVVEKPTGPRYQKNDPSRNTTNH